MYNKAKQFPPSVQEARIYVPDWKQQDYTRSLWYNAIHTYGLSGDDAAEYVRIERDLDNIDNAPFLELRPGEREALLRRHAELTNKHAGKIAA